MNVTATTLPRRSRSESRALSCVVNVNSGAGPIFDSGASAFASWPAAGPTPPTAATAANMATHQARRRPMLALQLLLELVDEPPVGALGDNLLRARLDHSSLMQPQGIEAQRVFGIVLAPPRVDDILHRPDGIVVARRDSLVDEGAGGPIRF